MRTGVKWTEQDNNLLAYWYRQKSIDVLAKMLERSEAAVQRQAVELGYTHNADDDLISLVELSRRTGRKTTVIHKVAAKLGIRLPRHVRVSARRQEDNREKCASGNRYAIPIEDAQRIIDFLHPISGRDRLDKMALGRWATDYDCCVKCHKTESRHAANGLCARCDARKRRPDCFVPVGCTRLYALGKEYGKGSASMRLAVRIARVPLMQGKHVYYVRDEDVPKVIAVLEEAKRVGKILKPTRGGAWGAAGKPSACLECHKDDVAHQAKGLCRACYSRVRRRQAKPLAPEAA